MRADRPWILLLGAAKAQPGLEWMNQARSRELNIWLTDAAENLEHTPKMVALADAVTPLSYRDAAACVAWATEQAKTTPFLGVFGFREFAVEAVTAVAQALELPRNPLEAVHCVRNKFTCRHALRERGFRQPGLALCSNPREARAFIAAHPPGPWIMKPLAASGSIGVSLIRDVADLEQAMKYLTSSFSALEKDFREQGVVEETLSHADGPFLMECFQRGEEFSAEGVFVYGQPHVLTLTSKLTLGAPHFVEVGHSMPAELNLEVTDTVKETVEAALLSLGLSWGHFHVEFWLEDGQPVLGEVHVRPGGDYIHFMTQHVTGIELYGVLYDQLLGRPVDLTHYQAHRGAAIRFLTPPPGRVTAISGWEEAASAQDCLLAELHLQVGDYIGPVSCSRDRPGFILTTRPTTREAIATVERLVAGVQVQVVGEVAEANAAEPYLCAGESSGGKQVA
jgi:biotin carboxylase